MFACVQRPAPAPVPVDIRVKLQAAYPDLRSGRFLVLADFDEPDELQAFTVLPGDGPEPQWDAFAGRAETDPAGLRLEASSGHSIRFDVGQIGADWTDWPLLLLSVKASSASPVRLIVRSADDLEWAMPFIAGPAWSLLRVDLGDVGDAVDLSHVESLAFEFDGEEPVQFDLDDIILADNSHWILAPSQRDGLSVELRGQRLVVRGPDELEWIYSKGALVSWRRARMPNVCVPNGCGPWLIPAGDDADGPLELSGYDDPSRFRHWGEVVATAQRVVESSAWRVVIETQWVYLADASGSPADPANPGVTWQHTIYPDGRLLVRLMADASGRGWPPAKQLEHVLAINGRSGLELLERPWSDRAPAARPVILARESRGAGLLWVTRPAPAARLSLRESSDGRRMALHAGPLPPHSQMQTAHLLCLSEASSVDERLQEIALDYERPAQLTAITGRTVVDAPGDFNADGFNEAEAVYECEASGGVLRLRVDPQVVPRSNLTLRVRGLGDGAVRVFLDGRMIPQGRDAENHVLVTLPGTLRRPAQLEIFGAGRGAETLESAAERQ